MLVTGEAFASNIACICDKRCDHCWMLCCFTGALEEKQSWPACPDRTSQLHGVDYCMYT